MQGKYMNESVNSSCNYAVISVTCCTNIMIDRYMCNVFVCSGRVALLFCYNNVAVDWNYIILL